MNNSLNDQLQDALDDPKNRAQEFERLRTNLCRAYDSGDENAADRALLDLLLAMKPLQARGMFWNLREEMREDATTNAELDRAQRMYNEAITTIVPLLEKARREREHRETPRTDAA